MSTWRSSNSANELAPRYQNRRADGSVALSGVVLDASGRRSNHVVTRASLRFLWTLEDRRPGVRRGDPGATAVTLGQR